MLVWEEKLSLQNLHCNRQNCSWKFLYTFMSKYFQLLSHRIVAVKSNVAVCSYGVSHKIVAVRICTSTCSHSVSHKLVAVRICTGMCTHGVSHKLVAVRVKTSMCSYSVSLKLVAARICTSMCTHGVSYKLVAAKRTSMHSCGASHMTVAVRVHIKIYLAEVWEAALKSRAPG